MSSQSSIEWTDSTWNPVRGCTKLSPGCKHCYAKTFAERFRGVVGHPYERGFEIRTVPERLADPLRWSSPRMIFVNSMSDLFHESVPETYISQVCEVMALANWHTYQILTKRSGRMAELLKGSLKKFAKMPHIWWGVSVENKKHGLPRIADLNRTSAAVKFLSVEPLLEDLGQMKLGKLSWVIVGGESGPGARSIQADWVRSIRDQCSVEGVPFFFKQWGGVRKKENGRTLDGHVYNGFPEVTRSSVLSLSERRRLAGQFSQAELVSISL